MELISRTIELIAGQLACRRNPAVAWSGGKDSQILLHLVRSLKPDISVVYFRGFPHLTKHNFVLRMAKEWDLNLSTPLPFVRDAIAKDGHVELVELYSLAPGRFMYFPIEAARDYEPDKDSHCGLAHLNGEMAAGVSNFDAVFIGHRNDDADPTHGAVPLKEHVVDYGDFAYVYPLKDWSEADIWAASKLLGIPQNEARYVEGDTSANADYADICTRCFLAPATCPQTGEDLPAAFEEALLEQRRADYRRVFVNIEL